MAWKRRCRPGDHLIVSDRTGFTIPASRARKEWTGAIVESNKWEAEHPQDKLPAFRDDMSVRDSRPQRIDEFVGALTTTVTAAAAAGATGLTVEATARMLAGDRIGVNLDSKDMFRTTIQEIASGTSLILSDALPAPVSIGNQVTNWTARATQGVS